MSKFGPFAIGARETARLAWRSRVDAAARAARAFDLVPGEPVAGAWIRFDTLYSELDAALSSPKPWRSGRRQNGRSDR